MANSSAGDKSNHVATIHLAQMLYLWPFIAFFSLPLLAPYALSLLGPLRRLALKRPSTDSASQEASSKSSQPTRSGAKGANQSPSGQSEPSLALKLTSSLLDRKSTWPLYIVATVVLSVLVVRFNTIVHPFTLADNRHYMFYVFRYSIRRSQTVRFALILPYTLSRWAVWGTLAGFTNGADEDTVLDCSKRRQSAPFVNHPLRLVTSHVEIDQTDASHQAVAEKGDKFAAESKESPQTSDPLASSAESISTSTAIVWLLATTLSLITAPLVEPRYFIIPWVMWRLFVPAWRLHENHGLVTASRSLSGGRLDGLFEMARRYDLRLVLETVWLIIINLATMYVFLTKPYQWKAEDGTLLDEGRWQRFMW